MVAFKHPKTEERGAAIRRFAAAAAAGHITVAGPETAARLNEAFAGVGLPYRVEPFDLVPEGCVYALCQPKLSDYMEGHDIA